jgi:hypothetical protein
VTTAGVLGAVLTGGVGMPSGLNHNGKGIMGYNLGNTGFNGPVGGWAGVMRADRQANGLLITVSGDNAVANTGPSFRAPGLASEVPATAFGNVRQALQIVNGGYAQSFVRNSNAAVTVDADYMVWSLGTNFVPDATIPVVTMPSPFTVALVPGQTITIINQDPDGPIVTPVGASGGPIPTFTAKTYIWDPTVFPFGSWIPTTP